MDSIIEDVRAAIVDYFATRRAAAFQNESDLQRERIVFDLQDVRYTIVLDITSENL